MVQFDIFVKNLLNFLGTSWKGYKITFALNSSASSFCFSQNIYCLYSAYICSLGLDIKFCADSALCLLKILIAVKGGGTAQLRYQKRERGVSMPKVSINIFDVSKRGGVGEGGH